MKPYDPHYQDERYSTDQYDPYSTQQPGHDYYQQGTDTHDGANFNPEESAIYPKQDLEDHRHFEISQEFNSPNVRLPRPPEHLQHESTTYPDQLSFYGAGEYPEGVSAYPDQNQMQQEPPYYDGAGDESATWAPIQATPPPSPRKTPELFAVPHVRASFGFGGQLVTVIPNNPKLHEPTTVEVSSLSDLLKGSSEAAFSEAVESTPGPLIPGDTPKSEVVRFASKEAEKCRQRAQSEKNEQTAQNLDDEALLWDFLVLLCQQNGVVLSSDIAELLMKDRTPFGKSATHVGASVNREEALDSYRQLLLSGRKKEALDLACSRALWGHALMLASGMDDQSRTYVVNRFTASLMTSDPLNTFYTLLLGRVPSAVKSEGLSRAGDWRAHLAMMLSNGASKLDTSCIVTLGDSLLSQGRLQAAHLCYYFGQVHFGRYGDTESKYSLFGVDHLGISVGDYPQSSQLCKMEVFEYAMSLSKKDFSLPHFQTFKLLYALKLLESGFVRRGERYCEQISYYVSRSPRSYTQGFLLILCQLSLDLHQANRPDGVIESELPSWLLQLQQSVTEALSSDYTPGVTSPSPAFSSVSQTYQQPLQPIIGLGQYLVVPGSGRGSSAEMTSGMSSKEDSLANMKLAVPTSESGGHQLETEELQPQESFASQANGQLYTVAPGGPNTVAGNPGQAFEGTTQPQAMAGYAGGMYQSPEGMFLGQQPSIGGEGGEGGGGGFPPLGSTYLGYDGTGYGMAGGDIATEPQPEGQQQQQHQQQHFQQPLTIPPQESSGAVTSTDGSVQQLSQVNYGTYPPDALNHPDGNYWQHLQEYQAEFGPGVGAPEQGGGVSTASQDVQSLAPHSLVSEDSSQPGTSPVAEQPVSHVTSEEEEEEKEEGIM